MEWRTVSMRWALAAAASAMLAWAGLAVSCKPSGGAGGAFQGPAGMDLGCRTTGDGYAWEGSSGIETGLADVDVTVFDTGRVEVELSVQAGLVWDSFLAHDPSGGFADAVYGHGVFLRADQRLSRTSDTEVVLNKGGTLVKYTLVENGVYAPVDDDGSRLTFGDDGAGRLKLGPQQYEILEPSSLPPVAGNYPVLVAASICGEPDCSGAHTTIATDETGRVRSITDPLGYVTRYDYDDQGRLQTVTFPDGRSDVLGYDGAGNLASVAYPPLTGGAPRPTRTYDYDGWKLTTARGPGGGGTVPQATFSIDDDGKLESLEPTDHDTTNISYQADTPSAGYTTVTFTDRTHLAGQNPIILVDDACALTQVTDDMKYTVNIARDAKHRVEAVSDPDDPSRDEAQLESPDTARDAWGNVHGTIDDELGGGYVFSPTDEDGLEGRPASSFSGPGGSGTIVYAKDDPDVTDLPSWAIDLPSDETWTTSVVDDQGQKNTLTAGAHHTYTNTTDPACPRRIVDTDKLTGLGQTTCINADGSKVLSVTDGYGLTTRFDQKDDPVQGETLETALPDGVRVVALSDPVGRPLQTKTVGYGDEEDDVYYGDGILQARRFPGANVTASAGSGSGAGFQQSVSVDPQSLLPTGDADEDGTSPVEGAAYGYYAEGIQKEIDVDYSNAGGAPAGVQSFICPWWAPTEACQ